MGNWNSGRRPRLFDRSEVESCHILDAGEWKHQVFRLPDHTGTWKFSETVSIGYTWCNQKLFLFYSIKQQSYCYQIALSSVPLAWGRARPAFLCPNCERRCYKLYMGLEPYFVCRSCGGLNYWLQHIRYGSLAYRYVRICNADTREENAYKRARDKRRNHGTLEGQ